MTDRFRFSDEDEDEGNDDTEQAERRQQGRRRLLRRRQLDESSRFVEVAKIVIPLLLAWGLSTYTARYEAREAASAAVQMEVAVIKATEQSHFEEIQRTLRRLDEWIARQESSRGR